MSARENRATNACRASVRQMIAVACLACGATPGFALADNTDKSPGTAVLDEVVVTATRRQERLQDVPVSATAFSQEKLDAQGLRSIDDLARLTPGVTFQRSGTTASGRISTTKTPASTSVASIRLREPPRSERLPLRIAWSNIARV